jgi:hypothetical protein
MSATTTHSPLAVKAVAAALIVGIMAAWIAMGAV